MRQNIQRLQTFFKNFSQRLYSGIGKITLALVTVGVVFVGISQTFDAAAATYIWDQASYAGGLDGGTYPLHASNQTNWTKYSAKDVGVTVSGGAATLTLTATTTTQNTAAAFDAGTYSTTVRTGTSIALTSASSGTLGVWSAKTSLPANLGNGGSIAFSTASADNFDVLKGGNTTTLWRYTIAGNSWAVPTALPVTVGNGGAFVSTNGDFFYAVAGGSSNTFYRFSQSGGTWTSRADTIAPAFTASALAYPASGDFIYGIVGSGQSGVSSFYKYSISGNSWSTLTTLGTIGDGAALAYPGSGDFLYAFRGNSLQEFWRYSITGNSWTQMTVPPATVGAGGSLVYPGTGDYIYALRGNSSTAFWRYSVSGNSWTTLTVAPETVSSGGNLLTYAGDSIYEINGGSSTFSKYVFQTTYNTPGTFTSSAIDLGQQSIPMTLVYVPTTPTGTTLKFQVRSATTSGGLSSATYYGPTSTSDFYTSSGQTLNSIHTGDRYFQYKAYLSTTDTTQTPSFTSVTINANYYPSSATLTSSAYNSSDSANVLAKIQWTATTPGTTGVKFQIRSAPDSSGVPGSYSSFMGPDGTSGTYFTSSSGADAMPSALTNGSGDQWFQYKAFLTTTDNSATPPSLSDVRVTYVANASPEFNTSFPSGGGTGVGAAQNSDGTVTINYSIRDSDTTTGSANPGFVSPYFEYSLDNGSTWAAVSTSTLAAGDVSNKAVDEASYTQYSATWDAKTQISGQYATQAKIRVIINDNEAANNTAAAVGASFALDTKNPALGAVPVSVDASQAPALITLSATDDTALQMKVGKVADLSDATYEAYSSSKTLSLADGDHVYAQFKDAENNTTSIVNVTLPTKPVGLYSKDVSNAVTSEWRVFFAWNVIPVPTAGFRRYNVYRSVDSGPYSLLTTVSDRLVNYIADTGLQLSSVYSYKVTAEDTNGDISFYSAAQSITPDGNDANNATLPILSAVTSSGVTTTGATITWTSDALSNSTVYYAAATSYPGTDKANYSASAGIPSMVTSHSVTLSHLSPGAQYYFLVESADVSGNTGTSTDAAYTFTTAGGPSISAVASSDVTDTAATITWTTSTNADSSVISSPNADLSSPATTGSTTLETSHHVTLTGLVPSSTYYYYVKSVDSGGNVAEDKNVVSSIPTYFSFNTGVSTATTSIITVIQTVFVGGGGGGITDNRDLTKPVITGLKIDQIGSNSASISFTTSKVTNESAAYGTSTSYGNVTAIPDLYRTTHKVVMTGLSPSTLYHFKAVAADIYKNEGTSEDTTFTTKAGSAPIDESVVDTTTPLSSDELAITEKVKTASYSFASKILEALSADKNLANVSDAALTTLVSNLATQFVSSPTISGTDISVDTGPKTAVLQWVTDKNSNSLVGYAKTSEYDPKKENPYSITAGAPDDSATTHKVELDNLDPDTTYHYQLRSQGVVGPASFSADRTFTTASLLPEIKQVQFDTIGENSVAMSWKTDVPAKTAIEVKNTQTGAVVKADEPGFLKDHTYTIDNLDYLTGYTVKLIATDSDNNVSTASVSPFSTSLSKGAPQISSVRITTSLIPDKEDTAQTIISWKTDKPSTSQVYFAEGAVADPKQSTTKDATLTRDHIIITTLLRPGTVYKIISESNDSSGNVTRSDPYTVLTPTQKGSVVDIIFNNLGKTFGFLKK